jgi:uncharacterized cysteine cluster protein YcgN (CxxCxxCC family)
MIERAKLSKRKRALADMNPSMEGMEQMREAGCSEGTISRKLSRNELSLIEWLFLQCTYYNLVTPNCTNYHNITLRTKCVAGEGKICIGYGREKNTYSAVP